MGAIILDEKKDSSKKNEGSQNGDWGIYEIKDILPIERFDPFTTYIDESGLIVGQKTIFSTIRRKRPDDYKHIQNLPMKNSDSSLKDTFCKIIEGTLPSIVITKDLVIENDPFSTQSLNNDLRSTKVFSTINLYPPIFRVIESKENQESIQPHPFGLSLVHIFTKHYLYPDKIPIKEWEIFLKNYCLTMKSCLEHPNVERGKNLTLHTFFNIGSRAGASIPHLHGQSVLYINSSGSGSKYNSYIQASQSHKECIKCQYWLKENITFFSNSLLIKDRVLVKNEDWMACLAYAPEKDAHIRLIPRRHVSALWQLTEKELNSLASLIIQCNVVLTKFIEHSGTKLKLVKDRNMIVRQLIHPDNNHFHMFIDLLPVQQLGGLEISDNQKISSYLPETLVSQMKIYIS